MVGILAISHRKLKTSDLKSVGRLSKVKGLMSLYSQIAVLSTEIILISFKIVHFMFFHMTHFAHLFVRQSHSAPRLNPTVNFVTMKFLDNFS